MQRPNGVHNGRISRDRRPQSKGLAVGIALVAGLLFGGATGFATSNVMSNAGITEQLRAINKQTAITFRLEEEAVSLQTKLASYQRKYEREKAAWLEHQRECEQEVNDFVNRESEKKAREDAALFCRLLQCYRSA